MTDLALQARETPNTWVYGKKSAQYHGTGGEPNFTVWIRGKDVVWFTFPGPSHHEFANTHHAALQLGKQIVQRLHAQQQEIAQ